MDTREELSEIRRQDKAQMIWDVAVIVIVIAAAITVLFFTIPAILSGPSTAKTTTTTSAPTTTNAVSTLTTLAFAPSDHINATRVMKVVKRILRIDEISDGQVFIISYKSEDSDMTNYSVYKSGGEIQASEGTLDSPNFIVYIDGGRFRELEGSKDVCASLRKLMDEGSIGGEAYASKLDLLWRFGSIRECINA